MVAGGDENATGVDINALADVLVAAYSDLVINGNDDMPSYLYLTKKATFALSDEVKTTIGHLQVNGGVALGLVTELVATGTAEDLFKEAVLPRNDDEDVLVGVEALNEACIQKVYDFITPTSQTKGVLLNNGVDITKDWAQNLISDAPTIDDLVKSDFDKIQTHLEKAGPDKNIIESMYAGTVASPLYTETPPVRAYLLENGVDLKYANQLEKVGREIFVI